MRQRHSKVGQGRDDREAYIEVEKFGGSREDLFPLFVQADDSEKEIATYIQLGEVLVVRHAQQVVGHLQLIAKGPEWEIKSLAVIEDHRGKGIGGALVHAAIEQAFSAGAARVLVATATADISNLRFYQRLGFRMDCVERDVFIADRGYPNLEVDDIPVRDRVWFSLSLNDWPD